MEPIIRCLVLVAGLCFDAHHVKAEVDNVGFGFTATITADRYKVQTGATDVIEMHDFRKAPKACVNGICTRYHKYCASTADAKAQCTYRIVWPGIVPDGAITVIAADHDALTVAEHETSLIVDRDGKFAKILLASMTVLALTARPDACPAALSYTDCDPP